MTEPTIDEMLNWLRLVQETWTDGSRTKPTINAIRAILEQRRPTEENLAADEAARRHVELEAIRAFVERVGVRYASDKLWGTGEIENYLRLMRDELAAMEKDHGREEAV